MSYPFQKSVGPDQELHDYITKDYIEREWIVDHHEDKHKKKMDSEMKEGTLKELFFPKTKDGKIDKAEHTDPSMIF
jgi:hypothetical protein